METPRYNDIPPEILAELDEAMDRNDNNPHFSVDDFFREKNIKPFNIVEVDKQPEDPKREERTAKLVRGALRLIGSGNKEMGMVHAEEALKPEVAGIDPAVIAAAPEKAERFYGIAEARLYRAMSMGKGALRLVLGEDYDFDTEENRSGQKMRQVVQQRLFGEDNKNFRSRVYRQLDKMAGIKPRKSRTSRRRLA